RLGGILSCYIKAHPCLISPRGSLQGRACMADSGQFRSLDRRVDYGRPWRLGAPGRPTITLSFLFADVCPSSVRPHADLGQSDVRAAWETTGAPYLASSRIGCK